MNTVWRVFVYLKRYPLLAFAMMACAITGTLMLIVFPAVTKWILDEVVTGHHPERLLPLLAVAAVAALLQNGLNSLRLLLNNTFEQKVIFDLRSDLYSHIQLLPLRWFDNRAAASSMNSLLHDNLSGIRQIKSFVREREEHIRFNQASDALRRATLVVMKVWAVYNPSMYLFGSLGVLLVVAVGTQDILSKAIQLGDLGAFLLLSGFLYEPVGKLHQLNQLLQAGRAAGERVFEIIDEPAESQRGRKFERAVREIGRAHV